MLPHRRLVHSSISHTQVRRASDRGKVQGLVPKLKQCEESAQVQEQLRRARDQAGVSLCEGGPGWDATGHPHRGSPLLNAGAQVRRRVCPYVREPRTRC